MDTKRLIKPETIQPLSERLEIVFQILTENPSPKSIAAMTGAIPEDRPALKLRAVEALIATKNLGGLAATLNNYDDLPGAALARMDDVPDLYQRVCLKMIKSPVKQDRLNAIYYLEKVGESSTIHALTLLMSSQDKDIRNAVLQTVRTLIENSLLRGANKDAETAKQLNKRERYELRQEQMKIIDALSDGLRSYSVHHNEGMIHLAFRFGKVAYAMLSEYALGQSILAAKIREIIFTTCEKEHIEFLMCLIIDKRTEATVLARLIISKMKIKPFIVAFEAYILDLDHRDLEDIGRTDTDMAWWPIVEGSLSVVSDEFIKRILEIAAANEDPRVLVLMCAAILKTKNRDLKKHVINRLAALDMSQAWWKIEIALKDEDQEIRHFALNKIVDSEFDDKLKMITPLINSADLGIRAVAIKEVSSASLERYMKSFSRLDTKNRMAAAQALDKLDPKLVGELTGMLTAMDSEQRLRAVQVIQLLGREKDAEKPLIELISDPDPKVRATVVKTMGLLGSADAVRAIVKALQDSDRRVKANAIEAFEHLKHPKIKEMIRPLMNHADNRIRGNAVKALLVMKEPTAVLALENMIHDTKPMMRRTAVWVLRESGLPDAIKRLRAIIDAENNKDVIERAKAAINHLKNLPSAGDAQ